MALFFSIFTPLPVNTCQWCDWRWCEIDLPADNDDAAVFTIKTLAAMLHSITTHGTYEIHLDFRVAKDLLVVGKTMADAAMACLFFFFAPNQTSNAWEANNIKRKNLSHRTYQMFRFVLFFSAFSIPNAAPEWTEKGGDGMVGVEWGWSEHKPAGWWARIFSIDGELERDKKEPKRYGACHCRLRIYIGIYIRQQRLNYF